MPARIVITGAGGQVGRFLGAELTARGRDLLACTSVQWDITDPAAGDDIVAPGDVVINCAALTAVDVAEAEPARAYAVNATGAGNVARACAARGARLVHISTDYVFGGDFDGAPRPYDVDDPVGPRSVYGQSKLAGERAVHDALPDATVVRTAWVYTGVGSDFVATMRRLESERDEIEVVADQTGSPTYVADLVGALLQIADDPGAPPLLHVVNTGPASRYELARAVFAGSGADPERVRPVSTDKHPRPAPRPVYSALSTARFDARYRPLRSWRDGLGAALAELN
ncbi:dTDP-4-dehydrorhamnose reductase [Mycobacterium adipatum]|uniref:dTDP-4-dehydrorhamnose reductase n=1 Tax=Mycobacterium adipatum TaxID=1682113 RepID=A0A172US29_9MYCO|nr:dTDP-4-dehydrorhamnose reductase [Mycobacterium adipatum]ANE81778.1 dTDP-4-dehydrorhamnose reductase [Mycobacterium adipatum]